MAAEEVSATVRALKRFFRMHPVLALVAYLIAYDVAALCVHATVIHEIDSLFLPFVTILCAGLIPGGLLWLLWFGSDEDHMLDEGSATVRALKRFFRMHPVLLFLALVALALVAYVIIGSVVTVLWTLAIIEGMKDSPFFDTVF